jgi:hypothetical protein
MPNIWSKALYVAYADMTLMLCLMALMSGADKPLAL